MMPQVLVAAAQVARAAGWGSPMDDDSAPVVGITAALDEGGELTGLHAQVAVHFADVALCRSLERAGAVPVLLPVSESPRAVQRYLDMVDGVLLSGGDGYLRRRALAGELPADLALLAPRRFRFEAALLQGALARDLPVLGICRGHQTIASVVGGPCLVPIEPTAGRHHVEDPPLGRRAVHTIRIEPGSRLHALVGAGTIAVNSLHRQAVGQVAPPLIISARADDGVVEALESSAHRFVLGVQFHPELLEEDAVWTRLFEGFVAACRESRRR